MALYRVKWEIDIEAPSRIEAAKKAREIQLNPDNTATFFDVRLFNRKNEADWHLFDVATDTE